LWCSLSDRRLNMFRLNLKGRCYIVKCCRNVITCCTKKSYTPECK
jgi:hypothetical protein